ncbi:MAG TPA: MmgE/PrpD family protein [Steroidobacteraceae bacterium]|jgi:2-methylcitrate dehydratase
MDSFVQEIADHVRSGRWSALPAPVVHECKRRIVDTLGCAIAAFDAEPSRIARTLAMRVSADEGARLLGTGHRTLPELATFANGVMARYLDGNDALPGGGGHPSDVIAPVLALADAFACSGRAAIEAIVVGYDVHYALFHALRVFEKGLDHPFYTAVATAAAAARLLALDEIQTINALSLAITPNIALGATRRGSLSMWKGCASANAARNGVFAALLARAGLTGPERPVEGSLGLSDLVGHPGLTLAGADQPFRILQADMKYFVTEFHSIAPIMMAMKLAKGRSTRDIEAIDIATYKFAYEEIGSGPEKWQPATRETADHSMPYIVAAVLINGGFSETIFEPARFSDEAILTLANKITIREDSELTRQLPHCFPCRMNMRFRNGHAQSTAMKYPRGHHDDPMSDQEVKDKFRHLASRKLSPDRIERALDHIWATDETRLAGDLFELFRTD